MKRQVYYTLLASLPALPRFDRAERLPISRERLLQRFKMLTPHDAALLEQISAFLTWEKFASTLSDEDMIKRFRDLREFMSHAHVQDFLGMPVDMRTVMAGLRRRHRGLPAPGEGENWGVGRYVHHMAEHWEDPHFKLDAVYPWIKEARTLLEAEDVLTLDRLLKNVLWDHLDSVVSAYDFGFFAVLAYRMKWDMLDQWLTHDAEKAGTRFDALIKEITHGQTTLFQ